MKKENWQYLSMPDGVDQLVYVTESGRRKFTENPEAPHLELVSFFESQEEVMLLIMGPCSKLSYDTAVGSAKNVIVVDYCNNRLDLFKKNNPKAKTKLITAEDDLYLLLSEHSELLEQGQVRSYIPERFAKIDPKMRKILLEDVLRHQKQLASLAVNRSLKRWHTNTNLLMNLKKVESSLLKFPSFNVPHVIVGAGPSLDYNILTLKKYETNAIIVATDGAVQSLIANSIKPDIVVSKEDTLMSWRFVAGIEDELKNVPLLLDFKGNHYLACSYPGQVIFTVSNNFESWAASVQDRFPYLDSGACVGHMAFNYALASSASEIIMVGFDLAYRGEVFHPKDMPIPYYHGLAEPDIDFVKGQSGQVIKTDLSMKMYLRHFEELIDKADVKVIDSTEGGAYKRGTEIMTLEDSLKGKEEVLKRNLFEFYDLKSDVLSMATQNCSKEQLIEPFTNYLLQRSDKFTKEMKVEDYREAEKYLEYLFKCPIHGGVNEAAFVTDEADQRFLFWLEEEGICVYSPKSLTESLKLCFDLELARIYCCNGLIDPDLLMLADVEIIDVKTSNETVPYERCLWNPSYEILANSMNFEHWKSHTPPDVTVSKINLFTREFAYGVS